MSRCKLRSPWSIHFKLRIVIGIGSFMVCILFGETSIFHSRVMGLYSSNCRRCFVCRAVNWELLGQFTSNFAQLLELIVLRSVYFLVKFRFFIPQSSNLATSPTAQASKITLACEISSICSKSGVISQLYVKKNVKNTDFGLVCQKVNREDWFQSYGTLFIKL